MMATTLDDALCSLEQSRDVLSGQMADQRSALASLKSSALEVVALATGRAHEELFKELLLSLDRLREERLTEELRDSVVEEVLEVLGRRGLTPVENGPKLNLRYHEVTEVVAAQSPEEEGDIVKVLREGYLLGGTLLRPSRVVVARATRER